MNDDTNNSAGLTLGRHIEPEDLLLYILDLLAPGERGAIEAHIQSGCAQCAQELAAVRNDIGIYAVAAVESAGLANAPARSHERLMAEIARADSRAESGKDSGRDSSAIAAAARTAPAAMALVEGSRGRAGGDRGSSALARTAAWVGWAVAAAIAIAATHFYQEREALRGSLMVQAGQIEQLTAEQARAREIVDALTDRSAQRVTLSLTKAPGPPQPTGRATYLAGRGTLIFLGSHLQPLPAGKTYELWVIPASGAAPVPAGIFHPDAQGNANVVTVRLGGAGAAKAFGITIEPSGGSPTPTLPIVMAGS
jgi:anti-sigma-K factor RskA